jgi:diguanylate cyclase (GGDEF)-like protein
VTQKINQVTGCESTMSELRIRALLLDDNQNLWVGTYEGLCKIKLDSAKNSGLFTGEEIKALHGKIIIKLFQDSKKNILIGTAEYGLIKINHKNSAIDFISQRALKSEAKLSTISSIAQPNDIEIWASTYGKGIYVFNINTGELIRHLRHESSQTNSINLDVIGALLVDDSGIVWVGTWGGGLNKANLANGAIVSLNQTDNSERTISHQITSMLELNSGEIWFGSWGNGITTFNYHLGFSRLKNKNNEAYKALDDLLINALQQDKFGTIWIGTNKGLLSYSMLDRELSQFKYNNYFQENVINALMVYDETIWIGTQNGVYLFNIEKQKLTEVRDKANMMKHSVTAFSKTSDGTVWIGSQKGLYYLPVDSKHLKLVSLTNSNLSSASIKGLIVTSSGDLWVSTALGVDRLVQRSNGDVVFESINQRIGFSEKYFGGNLIEDGMGRVWFFDYMIDPRTWEGFSLDQSIGWDVGTIWNGSKLKTNNGLILQGGTTGVQIVDTKKWQAWSYEPQTTITNLKVDNYLQPIFKDKTLVLPESSKSFSVEFSALDFSAPEKNQYAYQLSGYDSEWIKTGSENRNATYTNIPPGSYTLHIKGTNSRGQWSSNQINLKVAQRPSWYETTSAKIFFLVLFISGFHTYYLLRLKKIRNKREKLNILVSERTQNIERLGYIGRQLTSSLDIPNILQTVHANISHLIPSDLLFVALVDSQNKTITIGNVNKEKHAHQGQTFSLTDLNNPVVNCIVNNSKILTKSSNEFLLLFKSSENKSTNRTMESRIYLPLTVNKKTIGCISLQSYKKSAFKTNELNMLETICSFASIAINNANMQHALKLASNLDFLTQLPNRRKFSHQAQLEIDKIKIEKSANGVCFAISDIDHFKSINDTYGHDCGDFILKQVAEHFRKMIGENELVARWGGEEFVFMFPNTKLEAAFALLDTLRLSLANKKIRYNENLINVTATFGVSEVDSTYSLGTTLKNIDIALYYGKQNGRNSVIQFKPETKT